MPETTFLEPWDTIEALVASQNPLRLKNYLATLNSADIARAMGRLDDDTQAGMLMLIGPEEAADLIEELSHLQGADILEELPTEEAADIFDEMDSDHRVDVLQEFTDEEAQAILEAMEPEEAADARQLIEYPEDTAGGIMITEFLSYSQELTSGDVIDDLRANAQEYADYSVQYIYTTNQRGRLVGVIRLHDFVLALPQTPLAKIMIPNPLSVLVDSTLDEVNQFFDRYAFVGCPVVDHDGRLVGVVRRGDAEEATSERAEQSLMRFGGIITGEELRNMPLRLRSSRRILWLVINLALSLVAASVIKRYEDAVTACVAVVFFIPVVANMSGCSGNQAVAVSIRELTLGIIQPRDFFRVWLKEMQAGVFIGIILGAALAAIAYWLEASLPLALLVGGTLSLNILLSLSLGGLAPLAIRKAGLDPALAAPLILTTIADMCGFALMLGTASLLIAKGIL